MSGLLGSLAFYIAAAIAEIAGSFAFWAWLRLDRSPLWLVPGIASLILFALLLTRIDLDFAGRTYAAYGGIYISSSVAWLWIIEGQVPDRWDIIGMGFSLLGAMIILISPVLRG